MKRTLILISALFLMSMGVLAQMNIWRNGVVTHEFLLADVDSITFGALPETPGDAIMLNYKLTEFEGDRYGNRGYCYNVIFTTPGTDFEVKEVDLGGQTGYQYVLNRGTAYMIYIISDQLRSQVPEPGTYTIGWYDSDDSEYVQGEDYGRRGTFARGYNAAADLPNVDQHAPVGSCKMSKPEEGEYMVDYFDDDIYRYVRDGELEIIENANGSYTWNMTLKFNDLTTEKLTWTGKYEETEEEPEPELHPSLQGSDYFIFQMDDITYGKIASKVVADFRRNDVTNFLYIWENTYAAGSTQGLNFYGEPEGWLSLDVLNVGWSGCAYSVSDLELLNKLSAIMEEPENYYFHIAIKSTDNASHLLFLDGTAGSAKICIGESAFVDGGTTYQPMAGLKRDGSWNEIEICMADLFTQGLTYGSNNTNALNVLGALSGAVAGTNLQFDAAFIYKKNGGEIAEPELGTVKVVVDAPENTCNGMVAVGTFCNWSPSEGYPFTKVEGSESLYEVTVPYSSDMEFKVIAKTLYDEVFWDYQWGMNRDGEEPNVVLLGTPGCVLDNSENGGEPKLVSFVNGSLTYVEVKSWRTDPCVLQNEAGMATWFLTVPATTPETAVVSVVGNWRDNDSEYWVPGAVVMERMADGRYTLTKEVPAVFQYKYVVSVDGVTWSWDYQCERQFEMPASLIAEDVVEAWSSEPWILDEWAELNRRIKEDFNTTLTIPEPIGEYEFTVTKGSPFGNWVSGYYELTFNPQMINAVLNYSQVLRMAGWKKVINGDEEQGYATYYSDTQDYLIMPYIDETSHQFAILYIYNRNDVGTISNWEEIEDKATEVSLKGNILVDTYYGESFPIVDETEAYTLILTNEQAGTTYSVSLASYPNDLVAPLEGTYTIVDELTASEQATITKVFGEGENAVEVAGESGTLVISGNASNMEITLNIALADGDHETLHYSGQVQVEEHKLEMVSEHEILNVISMTLENSADYAESNYYYYLPTSSGYPAQGQLSAVVSSPQYPNGIMQIMLGFLFNGDQQSAATLPVGEYPFVNMHKGEGTDLDFITASDYYIYLINDYYGYYCYFSSEIHTITADGITTNIFFPQSGTLKIENGTTEGTMKFTINATSFNGSTFQGTFELPEYVESSSAPQRLAPKAAPQWNTYLLFKDAKLPNVPYKRAMR